MADTSGLNDRDIPLGQRLLDRPFLLMPRNGIGLVLLVTIVVGAD